MARQTLIHLSDLHIGLRQKGATRTKMIFDKIAKSFSGVPVIITGDLTNSATKSQFRKTRVLLDKLASTNPILAVPGNHDYAWKGNIPRKSAWANWVNYLGSPLGWGRAQVPWMEVDHEPAGVDGLGVWKAGPCVYFGIDSGHQKNKQISARGYISNRLAKALKQSLKDYKGKTRIALLHHHPFTQGFFTRLNGSKQLLDALRNNCELLLFGHHHKYGIWWRDRGLKLIVSSHKSTHAMSGDCLMTTIIDIAKVGTPDVSFRHRIEVV